MHFNDYVRKVKEDVKNAEGFDLLRSKDHQGHPLLRIVKLVPDCGSATLHELIAEIGYFADGHRKISRWMAYMKDGRKTTYNSGGEHMAEALHALLVKAGMPLKAASQFA